MMLVRTRTASAALLTAAVLATASTALAAHPVEGATYNGSWGPKLAHATIQFKVSSNGKSVTGFKIVSAPLACQGVVPPVKSGGHAAVSKKGTFSVSLPMYFPPNQPGRHVGSLVVTGKFGKNGKESGKLSSKFNGVSGFKPAICNNSVSYSAKG